MTKADQHFLLRGATIEEKRLGCNFVLTRTDAPDRQLQTRAIKAVRGGFEVEALEPISGLKLLRFEAPVNEIVSLFYKLPASKVARLGI